MISRLRTLNHSSNEPLRSTEPSQPHAQQTETVASLQAFRKRHSDALRQIEALKNQPTTVDLSKYRGTLKNQAIVDEAEKLLKGFKPVTYDVKEIVGAIEAFETKAVGFLFCCVRNYSV